MVDARLILICWMHIFFLPDPGVGSEGRAPFEFPGYGFLNSKTLLDPW